MYSDYNCYSQIHIIRIIRLYFIVREAYTFCQFLKIIPLPDSKRLVVRNKPHNVFFDIIH